MCTPVDGAGVRMEKAGGGVLSHVWFSDTHQARNVPLKHYSYAIMDHYPLQLFLPVCVSVCVSVCECVSAGQIRYQTTCLSKPLFNCTGSVCMLYNIIIPSTNINQIMASTRCKNCNVCYRSLARFRDCNRTSTDDSPSRFACVR